MSIEIPIYTYLDELYLYETDKFHYNRKTGEIFILGVEIGGLINRYTFRQLIKSVIEGDFISDDKLDKYPTLKTIDRYFSINLNIRGLDDLWILHMLNGFTPVHNIYVILRSNKFGFLSTLKAISLFSSKWLYRRYLEYLDWLKNPGYRPRSNYIWEGAKRGKLPKWQEYTREIILDIIKNDYPDKMNEFKVLDKKFRELVNMIGFTPFEVYTFYYLSNILKLNNPFKILSYPKIMFAEVIYLNYRKTGGKEIILYPLYTGRLVQSPGPEIL